MKVSTEPPAGALRQGLALVGSLTLDVLSDTRQILGLLGQTVQSLPAVEWRRVVEQVHCIGNRSIFFVGTIMSFTGAIMVVQASTQLERIIGDLTVVGPSFLQLIVREFGPVIAALMIAARYGAAVAAEIGAMKITEQLDALRMAGANPISFLVAPRVLGGVFGTVPVVVFASAIAYCVGGVSANTVFGIGWDTYFRTFLVDTGDVIVGFVKAVSFGVAVPLVACYAGLNARGGAPGVGRATTYAVIGSSVAVLCLDFIVGVLGYLIFP